MDRIQTQLVAPIAAYVQATNAQDADAITACFTSDAVVRDEGQDRRGVKEIRTWAEEVSKKYRPIVEALSIASQDGKIVVVGRVSGAFSGSPVQLRYVFALKGHHIAALEITP
jgi:ketosteroid isomerase-like protein